MGRWRARDKTFKNRCKSTSVEGKWRQAVTEGRERELVFHVFVDVACGKICVQETNPIQSIGIDDYL